MNPISGQTNSRVRPGYSEGARAFQGAIEPQLKTSNPPPALPPLRPLCIPPTLKKVPLLFLHISSLVVHSHFLSKHFSTALCFRLPSSAELSQRKQTGPTPRVRVRAHNSQHGLKRSKGDQTQTQLTTLRLIIHFLCTPECQFFPSHIARSSSSSPKGQQTHFHQSDCLKRYLSENLIF